MPSDKTKKNKKMGSPKKITSAPNTGAAFDAGGTFPKIARTKSSPMSKQRAAYQRDIQNSVLDQMATSGHIYSGLIISQTPTQDRTIYVSDMPTEYRQSQPIPRPNLGLTPRPSMVSNVGSSQHRLKFVVSRRHSPSGKILGSAINLTQKPTASRLSVSYKRDEEDNIPDTDMKVKITTGLSSASILETNLGDERQECPPSLVPLTTRPDLARWHKKQRCHRRLAKTEETVAAKCLDVFESERIINAEETKDAFVSARIPTLRRSPANIRTMPTVFSVLSASSSFNSILKSRSALSTPDSTSRLALKNSIFTHYKTLSAKKATKLDSVRIDSLDPYCKRFYHWAPFNFQQIMTVRTWVKKGAQGLLQPHLFSKPPKLSKFIDVVDESEEEQDSPESSITNTKITKGFRPKKSNSSGPKTPRLKLFKDSAPADKPYYGIK